jgi:tetratricopeptide (TPR) repeat protein
MNKVQIKFGMVLICIFFVGCAKAKDQPPEISQENEQYSSQYFSMNYPKGWVVKEVNGHGDVSGIDVEAYKAGEDSVQNVLEGTIVSVSFYDPKFPEFMIYVGVSKLASIDKKAGNGGAGNPEADTFFRRKGFTHFEIHEKNVSIGGLSGRESLTVMTNDQGQSQTVDQILIDQNNYRFSITCPQNKDFSENALNRLGEIINSFRPNDSSGNAFSSGPKTAEEYLNSGSNYYEQGNWAQAISDFTKAIEINSNYAEAYCLRGDSYDKQGNSTQAVSDFNKAIEINPNFAYAYGSRGLTYNKQGNSTQAVSDFNKAIEISPNDAKVYFVRGNFYFEQGNLTQAISDFTKAIEINPNFSEAYDSRGSLYYNQGNFTQAMSDINKALKINPNFAEAYNYRGSLYYNQGNFTQSMSDFNKALEINPNFAEVYNTRAMDYYYLKEYDNAWSDVHKAEALGMKVDPDLINALKKASGRDQ